MKADLGQHGGRVAVGFQSGSSFLPPGTAIPPSMAMAMPIENRCGLERAGYVVWHDKPQSEAPPTAARKGIRK